MESGTGAYLLGRAGSHTWAGHTVLGIDAGNRRRRGALEHHLPQGTMGALSHLPRGAQPSLGIHQVPALPISVLGR